MINLLITLTSFVVGAIVFLLTLAKVFFRPAKLRKTKKSPTSDFVPPTDDFVSHMAGDWRPPDMSSLEMLIKELLEQQGEEEKKRKKKKKKKKLTLLSP